MTRLYVFLAVWWSLGGATAFVMARRGFAPRAWTALGSAQTAGRGSAQTVA